MHGNLAPLPLSRNLERLFAMRNIVILAQLLAIIGVSHFLNMKLPLIPVATSIGFLILLNLATWLRLRLPYPVSETEFFMQLLCDVGALTLLLYFAGGSTNPFVSLYLLPLVVAATALPWRHTWSIAAITVACYTLMMFYFVPLPHSHEAMAFNLHVIAMWLTFVLSTMLIAWFVVKMSATLKERDLMLAKAREDSLRNEQIVALGTLAAGAAHELGTPLATMAVVANEMKQDDCADDAMRENVALLCSQIDACKRILTGLLASAGQARSEGGRTVAAKNFIEKLISDWQLMRPQVEAKLEINGPSPAPQLLYDQTLSQALMNLLNNAADASSNQVEIELSWTERSVIIEIRDRGPGLTPEVAANAGVSFFSTKPSGQGFGIGLVLANASIERAGGSVQIHNREGGGACTRVSLPAFAHSPEP